VVRSDRSMGGLLGLSEQDDIDRLRAEARRFIGSVAAITSHREPEGYWTTDYRYESRACPLSRIASTNSWFVNQN
jgi:hypothetical protein